MVMTARGGDAALRERLPALRRVIEHAHYSYLETDDSPEKLLQRKKLEGYIMEYLSIVPHESKFGLPETARVFQRTITESDFSAYRAGLGWAALARYADNLLSQPWRKEYKTIRLYCGYYKHEVEANMVGAEALLQALGYRPAGGGRLQLLEPACPDMAAAVSRDALIAHVECQIMSLIWEAVWGGGGRASWASVARERARRAGPPAAAAARLAGPRPGLHGSEIYSNVPAPLHQEPPAARPPPCGRYEEAPEEPIVPLIHPYMLPAMTPMYVQDPNNLMYGMPYYYPMPYMMPAPVAYAPIKQATTIPVNGYPPVAQYRYPAVPTAQLIELDTPSVYENGRYDGRRRGELESSRRNSTSKSGFSDVSLPSLPRSDTQPALSKAREDGKGTYESWDYVFRNLSSKDRGERSHASPSLERDSRTLDRLDRDERRSKYQPTTLDLEDGLQALNLDRTYDDEVYRTSKVNENLMRLKQEEEQKRARHTAKKQALEDRKNRQSVETVENPPADALIATKVAADKVRLLTKRDVKDRKEVLRQQSSVSSVNGSASSSEQKKVKIPVKSNSAEIEKPRRIENGHTAAHGSKTVIAGASQPAPSYDLKTQLIVSLDEADSAPRRSSPKQNGVHKSAITNGDTKWQCTTCTYLNKLSLAACEMCGKSKRAGPETQPLTSGGRECPTCTLVNNRDAKICDACGTGLDHCPTYI